MQGLKLSISLTFIILLAAAMLLINIIITALWQRSLVNNQIENSKLLLHIIAENYSKNGPGDNYPLTILAQENNKICAALLIEEKFQTFSNSGCPNSDELRQIMNQCSTTGDLRNVCSGKTWSVFSTQQKYLTLAQPIMHGQAIVGSIGLTYPLQSIWQAIRSDQKIILVYILVNTIVLSVIGFFRFAYLVIRPIEKLVRETSNYTGASEAEFVSDTGGSEFRQLSSSINTMVGRIEKDRLRLKEMVQSLEKANKQIRENQREMIRTEKLASVGRLSAGLAHEIGNPLGIVLGYLGLMKQKKISDAEKEEYINRSEKELNRINLLVRQLLDFSRPLPSSSAPAHVHALLADILKMLRAQKKNRQIDFIEQLHADIDLVKCNEEALRQALMNFYLNALDAILETATPEQGKIVTESKNIYNEGEAGILQIRITDNGCGISPEQLISIFDPFYTTKEPGKGTGLGLSVSYTIIENAGGKVRTESKEGEGTSMILEMPVLGDQAEG